MVQAGDQRPGKPSRRRGRHRCRPRAGRGRAGRGGTRAGKSLFELLQGNPKAINGRPDGMQEAVPAHARIYGASRNEAEAPQAQNKGQQEDGTGELKEGTGGLENPQGEDESKANASDQGQEEHRHRARTMCWAPRTQGPTNYSLNPEPKSPTPRLHSSFEPRSMTFVFQP